MEIGGFSGSPPICSDSWIKMSALSRSRRDEKPVQRNTTLLAPPRRVHAEAHRRWTVCEDVHEEDLDRVERRRVAGQACGQDRGDRCDVRRQLEADEGDDVLVDRPTALDRLDDRGEVVVGEDHRRGLLGDLRPGDAHGDADVGRLQRRCVVDAIARHGHDVTAALPGFDDTLFMLGRYAGIHRGFFDARGKIGIAEQT